MCNKNTAQLHSWAHSFILGHIFFPPNKNSIRTIIRIFQSVTTHTGVQPEHRFFEAGTDGWTSSLVFHYCSFVPSILELACTNLAWVSLHRDAFWWIDLPLVAELKSTKTVNFATDIKGIWWKIYKRTHGSEVFKTSNCAFLLAISADTLS